MSYQQKEGFSSRDSNRQGQDVFLYISESRQVPNWIALDTSLSLEARNLAHRIIIGPNGLAQPTLEYYAEVIGVTPRTAYRWLESICKAGYCTIERVGRRTLYRFYNEPITDTAQISSRNPTTDTAQISSRIPTTDTARITDPHAISDPSCVSSRAERVSNRQRTTMPQNGSNPQHAITDPVHGGGGGSLSVYESTNTTQPAPARWIRPAEPQTETEKHMRREWHFSVRKAYELRNLNLAACKADYARRWAENQRQGAIIQAWELEPPPAPAAPLETAPHFDLPDLSVLDEPSPLVYDPTRGTWVDPSQLDRRDPVVKRWLEETGL